MQPTPHRSSLLAPRSSLTVALLLLLAALSVTALRPAPAHAATITVTTTADANPPAGACTLRQAIEAANADMAVGGCLAGSGVDTIIFAPNVAGTIALTATLPAITSVIGITGPGAGNLTISGGGMVQILQVNTGAELSLTGLTLANGRADLDQGGAIFSQGSLTITTSTLSGNQATHGGAIYNDGGSLTITESTFSGNTASISGGAIYGLETTVTITDSTLSGNQAVGGAGDGGAIVTAGTLTVTNSTLNGNSAGRSGGAIFVGLIPSQVELTNSTIANNPSGTGSVLDLITGTASLHNVVLDNPFPSCGGGGAFTDQGGNIAADATCPVTTTSSHNDTDPQLGGLANNGGPTQTMALQPGSPAIDAAVDCPPPATDQRGVPRPHGAACDSGAYEAAAAPALTLTDIDPAKGSAYGGTKVTLTGTGFQDGATVTFDGTDADDIVVVSDTEITATTPAHPIEPVDVTVTNPDDQSDTLQGAYTFVAAPTITNITPNFEGAGAGTVVSITGSGFNTTTGGTRFVDAGNPNDVDVFTEVQCASATTCTATSQPNVGPSAGNLITSPIAALVNGVRSDASVDYFQYGEPVIDAISPAAGPATGGTMVTISGGTFPDGTAAFPGPVPTVRFGDVSAEDVSCSTGACSATAPPGMGTVQVTIETPGGTSNALAYTYEAAAPPAITGIDPTEGPAAGGTMVTLTGSGFQPGATMRFDGLPASDVVVVSATEIQATTPPHAAGPVTVSVQNPNSQGASLPNGFTYLDPTPVVTSISPSQGPEAGGTPVTIQGSGFRPGATTITFGGVPAGGVSCASTTQCRAVSPSGQGTVSVQVTVAGRTSADTPADDFTYEPPPPQPMTLTGQVWRQIPPMVSEGQIEPTIVPVVGGVVEALIDGVVCGQGVTDSQGRVTLTVAADPPAPGCGTHAGGSVTFVVNGQVAFSDPLRFQSGGQAGVTLILPGPMPPPRR